MKSYYILSIILIHATVYSEETPLHRLLNNFRTDRKNISWGGAITISDDLVSQVKLLVEQHPEYTKKRDTSGKTSYDIVDKDYRPVQRLVQARPHDDWFEEDDAQKKKRGELLELLKPR